MLMKTANRILFYSLIIFHCVCVYMHICLCHNFFCLWYFLPVLFCHNCLFLVLLGLCGHMDFSLVVASGDFSQGLLTAAASLAEHRLWVVLALGAAAHGPSSGGSWVLEHWLSTCGPGA